MIGLFARLHGNVNKDRRNELIERFNLDPSGKCRTYSRGSRQKVELISVLASDVELLLLDEPTAAALIVAVICWVPRSAAGAGRAVAWRSPQPVSSC